MQQQNTTLTARVVGFSAGSPTTYTTEVALSSSSTATYTLALRYSTFHTAYTKLMEVDSTFAFDFPKKGGFFSSPSPEERQPQLDAFLRAVVTHLATSAVAEQLRDVVEELLEVEAHRVPEEKKAELTEEVAVEVAVEVEETTIPKKSNDVASDTECSDDNVEEEEPQTAEPVAEPLVEVAEEEAEEEANSCCCCDTEKKEAVEEKETKGHPTPVVEEIKEEVKAEPVVESAKEEIVAVSTPKAEQPKPKLAGDPLRVVATTTSLSAAGEKVQHITFANGMTLKKKSLSADQKKLRNMRRKEKRKKKANMKVRGVKASAGCVSSSEDNGDY
jgi:hypothetical protein